MRRRLAPIVAVGAVAAVLSQVQPPPAQAAARADGHRPVVFVHGWSGNPSTFDDMKKHFRSAGYTEDELFAWGYDSLPEQSHTVTYQGAVVSSGSVSDTTVERAGEFHGDWVRLPGSGTYSLSVEYRQKGPYWGAGPTRSGRFSLDIPAS
ncbi:esterase/lipase family protein [Kitasatospora sp. NPDC059408]|uniref:esterase/lipase family protein n=1 Tax=Kitasatospora sp. NPDC059408 TaxID=3346823 RepID=UPI0036B8FFEF